MSSDLTEHQEINWASEPLVEVSTLLSGASFQVPLRAARQWSVFNKYHAGQPISSMSTFVFPGFFDRDESIIPLIIDFSKQLCEIRIAHIPGPLYDTRNLMQSPYNVPKWAFDWIMDRDLGEVFALLEAGHEL
jgi:hypothetical protein